jgi:hypothetical protein
MAKKDFKQGLDFLIQNTKENIENPKVTDKEKTEESGSQKATYYFNSRNLNTIKAIAWYDRKPIGQVIDEALSLYIKNYSEPQKARKLFREDSGKA